MALQGVGGKKEGERRAREKEEEGRVSKKDTGVLQRGGKLSRRIGRGRRKNGR